MNVFIENLNLWGNDFLRLAWPMLWQSSLLIAFLFGLDYLCRRHLRTSIRYALWLVVLVKLCLPPTLALPTSPVWWLHKVPSPTAPAAARHFTVTYDQEPQPAIPPAETPVPAPAPATTTAACLLVGSSVISGLLLTWLLVRWAQITQRVRRAASSERLTSLARETQSALGLKSKIQVRLTANLMSPAVCGLFHPAILIPRSLTGHFSDEQLRAVLLHELIHLRRRDVWVNFLQALLQIVYWWHPLVWLANARLRRVREEAVDDAVVLALRDEADSYAPTLLAVAKLALSRPLVSLGLVGIMENRHALRQRIERLLDARAPRRTGLTLASLLGILAFTAVAVPMGDAPAKPVDESIDPLTAPDPILTMTVNPQVFMQNIRAEAGLTKCSATDSCTNILLEILHLEGVTFGRPGSFKFDPRTGEITTQQISDSLEIFRRVIEQLNRPDGQCALPLDPSSLHRRSVLINAQFYSLSPADFRKVFNMFPFKTMNTVVGKSVVASIAADHLAAFNDEFKALGVSPFSRPRIETAHGTTATFFVGTSANGVEVNGVDFTCRPEVGDEGISLTFRAKVTGEPNADGTLTGAAKREVSGTVLAENHGGFLVCANDPAAPDNHKLVLVIDVKTVTNNSPPKAHAGSSTATDHGNASAVQAQRDDQVRAQLAQKPIRSQLHIKARFLEVPNGTAEEFDKFLLATNADGSVMGILTKNKFQTVLHSLEMRHGTINRAEPEVTTTSGRRTQMRATTIVTVITNANFQRSSEGTNTITFPTCELETGPVLDATGHVLPDGRTIDLQTKALFVEFLGYDKPPDHAFGDAGDNSPVILPSVSVRQASADLKLWDGQTVMLGKLTKHFCDFGQHYFLNGKRFQFGDADFVKTSDLDLTKTALPDFKPGNDDKEILVFITANIVDPAGNRVHSDADLAFTQNAVPSQ